MVEGPSEQQLEWTASIVEEAEKEEDVLLQGKPGQKRNFKQARAALNNARTSRGFIPQKSGWKFHGQVNGQVQQQAPPPRGSPPQLRSSQAPSRSGPLPKLCTGCGEFTTTHTHLTCPKEKQLTTNRGPPRRTAPAGRGRPQGRGGHTGYLEAWEEDSFLVTGPFDGEEVTARIFMVTDSIPEDAAPTVRLGTVGEELVARGAHSKCGTIFCENLVKVLCMCGTHLCGKCWYMHGQSLKEGLCEKPPANTGCPIHGKASACICKKSGRATPLPQWDCGPAKDQPRPEWYCRRHHDRCLGTGQIESPRGFGCGLCGDRIVPFYQLEADRQQEGCPECVAVPRHTGQPSHKWCTCVCHGAGGDLPREEENMWHWRCGHRQNIEHIYMVLDNNNGPKKKNDDDSSSPESTETTRRMVPPQEAEGESSCTARGTRPPVWRSASAVFFFRRIPWRAVQWYSRRPADIPFDWRAAGTTRDGSMPRLWSGERSLIGYQAMRGVLRCREESETS